MFVFCVDAETDGLYGEVWAIGAVVAHGGGVVDTFAGQVPTADLTDEWVKANVVPVVTLPLYGSRRALRDAFWAFWLKCRKEAIALADFGAPVEAGLFRACVADDPGARRWLGPYPLHELGTALLLAGVDPDVDRMAFSGCEGNKHSPVDDARASAMCWFRVAPDGGAERSER